MSSEHFDIQLRAWIGPQWQPEGAAAFWDWSYIDSGSWQDLAAVASTLAGDLEPGASSLTLADAAGWPSAGGAWVFGNGAGECVEYVAYTGKSGNTLTGLTRETVDAEQSGHHALGARVQMWALVGTLGDGLEISESSENECCYGAWTISIKGSQMPRGILRNDHTCIIEMRDANATGVDPWMVFYLGWIANPHVADDAAGTADWSAEVLSSAELLRAIEIPGVHNGPINAAPAGQAQGSPELATWYKMTWSGALPRADPPLSPDQAIDKDKGTVYISEHHLAWATNRPAGWTTTDDRHCVDQLHITRYTGQPAGYRWMQFRPGRRVRIYNTAGVCFVSHGEVWLNGHDQEPGDVPEFVIVCENTGLFELENPDYAGQTLIEISDNTIGSLYDFWHDGSAGFDVAGYTAQDWWDGFDPAAGGMAMVQLDDHWLQGLVFWGTANPVAIANHWESRLRGVWTGTPISAPGPGQTIWRVYAGGNADPTGWLISHVSEPGRYLTTDTRGWLLVGLPGLNCALAQDCDSDDTTLYVQVGDTRSSSGLPDAGTLQVGDEQIGYTAKQRGVLTGCTRGVNNTTAGSHTAGDQVRVVVAGEAIDCKPVDKIVLVSKTGQPVPQAFEVWGYPYAMQPRTPDEANEADPFYLRDYTAIRTETSNALSTYTIDLVPNARYRWILVVCSRMSISAARLQLAELQVYIDTAAEDPDTCVPAGTAYQMAAAMGCLAGLPAHAIMDIGASLTLSGEITSEPGPAWKVMADLADMTRERILCGRDSKIYVAPAVPARLANKTLDAKYDFSWASGHDVSQVQMAWQTPDGQTKGTVYYPPAPDALGSVAKFGPRIYADEAAALAGARLEYWQQRRRYEAIVEVAEYDVYTRPGDRVTATWQVDPTMPAMARSCQVARVDMAAHDGQIDTVVHLQQIGREDQK